MPRIRTIKPEFFANEKLSSLPPAIHLLAAGLLCYADDEGYFNAHPGLIRAHCMPLREDSGSPTEMLRELSKIGFLDLATAADGKNLGRIVKFREHQSINKPTPSKIKELWPKPNGSGSPTGVLPDDYRGERKGKEQGKEQGKELKNTPPTPSNESGGVAEQPVVEPPPSGVRVMPPPSWKLTDDQRRLVDFVLTGSPPGLVAHLSEGTITPVHRALVIEAVKREAMEHHVSYGEALDMVLKSSQDQSANIPFERLKFCGDFEKYFNKATYRKAAIHFQEQSNGKCKSERLMDNARQAASELAKHFGGTHEDGTATAGQRLHRNAKALHG